MIYIPLVNFWIYDWFLVTVLSDLEWVQLKLLDYFIQDSIIWTMYCQHCCSGRLCNLTVYTFHQVCRKILDKLISQSWYFIPFSNVLFAHILVQKVDNMFAAFTGQPLEKVQQYTERDRFLSVSEVMPSSPLYLVVNAIQCLHFLWSPKGEKNTISYMI